jgi:hypothetical protein
MMYRACATLSDLDFSSDDSSSSEEDERPKRKTSDFTELCLMGKSSRHISDSDSDVSDDSSPEYLRWSGSRVTFDWMDHSDSIPRPRRFPLIVDLLVGTTRLTKVLMDRGSGLNLMYLNTFEGLGLTRDQL